MLPDSKAQCLKNHVADKLDVICSDDFKLEFFKPAFYPAAALSAFSFSFH